MLAGRPEDYSAGDILRVTEGSLEPVPCIGGGAGRCERQEECTANAFWEGLGRVIAEYVDSVSLSDLIKTEAIFQNRIIVRQRRSKTASGCIGCCIRHWRRGWICGRGSGKKRGRMSAFDRS